MKNIPLARKVMEQIRNEPDKLDMRTWVNVGDEIFNPDCEIIIEKMNCGTTACFAGWTCLINGDTISINNYQTVSGPNGDHVSHRAAELLGLSRSEAMDLFHYTSNEHIESSVERIFGERL